MNDPIAVKVERLKNRRDFLAVKKGVRSHGRHFSLQAGQSNQNNQGNPSSFRSDVARFGITVTRQVGNSVVRNRIRRRLREAIRLNGVRNVRPGTDYVLVARKPALQAPFCDLTGELSTGLQRVDKKRSFKKR